MKGDIIIYTKPETLLHKQGKLENDPDHSDMGEYYWELPRPPKHTAFGNKIYFATKGLIRGYFTIENIDYDRIEWYCDTWKDVKPIPIKHFQGFKYADKVEELNDKK